MVFVQLLLEVVYEEVHLFLKLVKCHVVALAALGLLFEWLKKMFCITKQAPLGLRQLTGAELRVIVDRAGHLGLQDNGTSKVIGSVGSGFEPKSEPTRSQEYANQNNQWKPLPK